jgi:K+ potassium transporter integral membrane domain
MARDGTVSPTKSDRSSGTPDATAFWALTLGSIGVVYGDIGTSPLYAVRESVLAAVGPSAMTVRNMSCPENAPLVQGAAVYKVSA